MRFEGRTLCLRPCYRHIPLTRRTRGCAWIFLFILFSRLDRQCLDQRIGVGISHIPVNQNVDR
jgi:hypothetical protein